MALGAIQALKGVKKPLGAGEGKIVVGGIDATQDAMKAMKADELAVTVFQDAAGQGKGALETALKMIAKEPVEQNVWIPFETGHPRKSGNLRQPQLTLWQNRCMAAGAPPCGAALVRCNAADVRRR